MYKDSKSTNLTKRNKDEYPAHVPERMFSTPTSRACGKKPLPIPPPAKTAAPLRTLPPRLAKTTANQRISLRPQLPSAAAFLNYPQLPSVKVGICDSTIQGAGKGLFLILGPNNDGSASVGMRLCTYDGPYFTKQEDFSRLLDPSYRNDYLWEGINPFSNQRIIVDGSTQNSGYGPMMNDGLFKHESNVTLEFGNDNKIYVVALSPIDAHSELFFSYGAEYWMDPTRWSLLDRRTQQCIQRAYPETRFLLLKQHVEPLITLFPERSSQLVGAPLRRPRKSKSTAEAISSPTNSRVRLEEHRTLSDCFGQSSDATTRISLHNADEQVLKDLYQQLLPIAKTDAYSILTNFLDQISIYYWKRLDISQYHSSKPNGACGWYTIMQMINKFAGKPLLDLNDTIDLNRGCFLLKAAIQGADLTDSERDKGSRALTFVTNNTQTNITLPTQDWITAKQIVRMVSPIPCAVFMLESHERHLKMPEQDDWIRLLHSSESAQQEDALTVPEATTLAAYNNFSILSDSHFWTFPEGDESSRLDSALRALSYSLWDMAHKAPCPVILRPTHNTNSTGTIVAEIDLTVQKNRHARRRESIFRNDEVVITNTKLLQIIPSVTALEHNTTVTSLNKMNREQSLPRQSTGSSTCVSENIQEDIDINIDETPPPSSSAEETTTIEGYAALPPIKKFVHFDGNSHLIIQESDLATDPLSTLCSSNNLKGQLRVSSLNVNGLTMVKLGFLLTYMELKKLDVLALQDTRLSATESSTCGS
jgi:hypothetical protein